MAFFWGACSAKQRTTLLPKVSVFFAGVLTLSGPQRLEDLFFETFSFANDLGLFFRKKSQVLRLES